MNAMTRFTKLRGLFQRRRAERQIDDELAFHVEMETQANVARGMAPEEARKVALRALGGTTQVREAIREVRRLSIEWLWQDVRHASRRLARRPGFTLTATGMLALGIGLTTAMFTVVDALLLRPVPFRNPEQLATVAMLGPTERSTHVTTAVLRAWRDARVFASVEGANGGPVVVDTPSGPITTTRATITPGLVEMLGVRPLLGRPFGEADG
jgi:hypothetical protein